MCFQFVCIKQAAALTKRFSLSSNALLRGHYRRDVLWRSARSNRLIGMMICLWLWAVVKLWCTSINNSAPIHGENKDPIDCLFLPSGSLVPDPYLTSLLFFFVGFILLMRHFLFCSPLSYCCGWGPIQTWAKSLWQKHNADACLCSEAVCSNNLAQCGTGCHR